MYEFTPQATLPVRVLTSISLTYEVTSLLAGTKTIAVHVNSCLTDRYR